MMRTWRRGLTDCELRQMETREELGETIISYKDPVQIKVTVGVKSPDKLKVEQAGYQPGRVVRVTPLGNQLLSPQDRLVMRGSVYEVISLPAEGYLRNNAVYAQWIKYEG